MMRNLLFVLSAVIFISSHGCTNPGNGKSKEIIVFHAGSLSIPLKQLSAEYEKKNPGTKILLEPAGSLVCARKITEMKKPCDIIASADYFVIDKLLIPDYTTWGIKFATNEIVIACNPKAKYASRIDSINWIDILLRDDVIYARSDPDSDPCGYRTVMVFMLAEKYYDRPGLAGKLMAKDRDFIRPKEVDLVALVEAGAVDYMFQYKSVAIQHDLNYIELPDDVNLGNPAKNGIYNTVSVEVAGNDPGSRMTVKGEYINYSLSVLTDAPDEEGSLDFVSFLLGSEGMAIFRKNGQEPVVPLSTGQPEMIPDKLLKYLNSDNL